ncbi:MAG: hypothetical protein JRD04_07875 [Deltaproteobacteria bacterium]|nr:hypothetical protein [Deltaproteobacteria bacterium]
MNDIADHCIERVDFLVNAAFDNDNGTGESFTLAVGLIKDVLAIYEEEISVKEPTP